ncbi:MAG: hypothetical protein ABJN96_02355 [Marinomonas sp.]
MYNSGYEELDWHVLKHAVLASSNSNSKGNYKIFDELPEHLRASEIGDLIYQSVYLGYKKAVKKAAKELTGGANESWVILLKS